MILYNKQIEKTELVVRPDLVTQAVATQGMMVEEVPEWPPGGAWPIQKRLSTKPVTALAEETSVFWKRGLTRAETYSPLS